MRFSDGMEFNTSGAYRIEERSDGLYVVGQGIMFAIETREEGEQFIAAEKRHREAQAERCQPWGDDDGS